MRRALPIAVLALFAIAAGPALAQSSPPSGPRDRVREERPERTTPPKPRRERPERRRGARPSGGALTVVPGSELSTSPGRTRSDDRGLNPNVGRVENFEALIGFDEARLKGVLGDPALARSEGQGSMWTYRLRSCALMVFLARDASGVLKVKGGSAGPLVRGAPTPGLDACVAEAPRSRPRD